MTLRRQYSDVTISCRYALWTYECTPTQIGDHECTPTMSAPRPKFVTMATTSSNFIYCRENCSGSIPSLTLRPCGDDKSKIKRHFPGWPALGITPKLLTCKLGSGLLRKGPATRPKATSFCRYASTISGWAVAEALFFRAEVTGNWGRKPISKPWAIPLRTYSTFERSGCLWRQINEH